MNFLSGISHKPTIFVNYATPTLINSETEPQRDYIIRTAREVQSIADKTLFISASLAVGSLVCNLPAIVFIVTGAIALACYDMHNLANNIDSIFSANFDSRCKLVQKNVSGFTKEMTNKTIIISLFNPVIEKILKMSIC